MTRKKKTPAPPSPASLLEESLSRLLPLLPPSEHAALLAELALPHRQGIRANTLKVDPALAFPEWAARYGWELAPIPFCPEGRQILSARQTPGGTEAHLKGQYYLQDVASMLPASLFTFAPGSAPLVLDMAASPGGKTTHLACRTGDRGLLLANDSAASRLMALRVVLQSWGTCSVAITNFPGERFGAWYPETFDAVLLDAPCSMEGLRPTEAHALRPATEKERQGLSHRQQALLESALQCVKIGGEVVYATCSLAPEEDEVVLDWLMRQWPGTVEITDIRAHLGLDAGGLPAWQGQAFAAGVERSARLWPQHFHTAGFFTAHLVKTAPIPGRHKSPPARPLARTGFHPASTAQAEAACRALQEQCGLDLAAWMVERGLELWQHGDGLHLMPQALLTRFETLPVKYAGLPLGRMSTGGLELTQAAKVSFPCTILSTLRDPF